MCIILYLALVRLCLNTVGVIVLNSVLLFVEYRCFVFFTDDKLENMFPLDNFWFGANAAQ